MAKIDPRLTRAISDAAGKPLQAVFTLRGDSPTAPLTPGKTEEYVKAVVDRASRQTQSTPNRVVVFENLQSFSIDADAGLIQNILDQDQIETAALNKG